MSKKKTSQIFSHRYQMLKHLGEGGIGKVYRTYDRWIGKEVALKVSTAEVENFSLLESFKTEFLLLAQLRHPGVVEALDFGYSDEIQSGKLFPYFTMELVEGKNLEKTFNSFFDPHQAMAEFERLIRLIWQICDILEFLHLRGIVHCDLKPDNLKVTDRIFRPKILDFGLSEKVKSKRGQEKKGTLPYMAPEMFKEEALDERTDLYSLGVILYELVTSKLPFSFDDPVKIISAHLQQEPTPPSELNHNLPPSLDELIMKLLEKSPGDRPDNAAQVKEIIEAGLKRDFKKAKRFDFSEEKTFLAHLYSGPMVGRETEFSQLENNLKQAASSRGSCLFLAGEQGVGKTFLFKHLKMNCQLRGIIFVDSTCLEKQTLAYQPLMEILHKLEPYAENRCPEQIVQNLKGVFKWSGDNSSTSLQAQSSFHQKITDLLLGISQFFPVAMVIENLQWADLSTLKFLEYFKRQEDKGRIFLCCSLRDEKLKEKAPLQTLVDHCAKEGNNEYLRLNRFDLSQTRSLISSKLTKQKFQPELFDYVHQRTSGNPFFIIEVLKYLMENNTIGLSDSIWTADIKKLRESLVPDSIEAVLLKNLERYDKKMLYFLNVIAVIGKRFTFKLVKKLNLFDKKTISEILSFLTNDQLLIRKEESAEDKTYYEFANQSLQTLLYQRLNVPKRISWHKKVAELLEKIGLKEGEDSVFEIAHHYLEGEEFEKAYQYALLSAEKMEQRFANDEVLRYLEKAIEAALKFSDRQKAKKQQAMALMRRADFCRRVGELNQAEKDYLTVLKLTESSSDLKILAKTYNDLGETYRLKHDYKKGIWCLKKAMHIHQKLDDPHQLADTLSYMGLLYWTDSQYKEALDCFQEALKIDQKLGKKSSLASTLNNMGLVFWSQQQYSQALKYFTESLSQYRDLDNKEWIARSLNNIGATHFYLGEYYQAINYYLESLKLNEKIKNKKEMTFNLENLGDAYGKTGDYQNALKYCQQGLKLVSEIDFTERAGYILEELGIIHFDLGHYQKAYEYLDQAKIIAEKIEDKELQILALVNLGKSFSVLNDDQRAEQRLSEATRLIGAINDKKSLIKVYQIKSNLRKKERKFQEALTLLDQAMDLAKKASTQEELLSLNLEYSKLYFDWEDIEKTKEFLTKVSNSELRRYVLFQPEFHLISGTTELKRGNLKQAQKDLESAMKLGEKLNRPEILWQIHHHLGKLFLSSHNVERAYQQFENAGTILKRLSESIKDEELRRTYLEDPRKEELLSDLKEVAKELIGETNTV